MGLSKFRATLNVWDVSLAESEEGDKIRHFADAHGLVLFFKKDGDYFGAGEDSRLVFARLKNPDDETGEGWAEEANFSAINLSKLAGGEVCQNLFDKDDLKKIKIIDQDEVVKSVKKSKIEKPSLSFSIISKKEEPNRDDAPNFLRTDEE